MKSEKANGVLFVLAVEHELLTWHDAQGLQVKVDPFGLGSIVTVELRPNNPCFHIEFVQATEGVTRRKFAQKLFTSEALQEMDLPSLLADNLHLQQQLLQKGHPPPATRFCQAPS